MSMWTKFKSLLGIVPHSMVEKSKARVIVLEKLDGVSPVDALIETRKQRAKTVTSDVKDEPS